MGDLEEADNFEPQRLDFDEEGEVEQTSSEPFEEEEQPEAELEPGVVEQDDMVEERAAEEESSALAEPSGEERTFQG